MQQADTLILYQDAEALLTITRGEGIPGQLRGFLAQMDADMDAGIELDGDLIVHPDARERARFVLGELAEAVAEQQSRLIHILLTYLSLNWPELQAVRLSEEAEHWVVQVDLKPD